MFNLRNLFGAKAQKSSKSTAKNRLQMVLVQDRSGLTSQDMDNFKKDLLAVIARYFVVDQKTIEIEWQREDNCTALIINTPVQGKREEKKVAVAGA